MTCLSAPGAQVPGWAPHAGLAPGPRKAGVGEAAASPCGREWFLPGTPLSVAEDAPVDRSVLNVT